MKQFLTYVNGSPFQPAIAVGLDLPDSYFQDAAQTLARRCGLSQSAISSYESGSRKAPSKVLAIAQALEVSVWWLARGEGAMLPGATASTLQESTWPFPTISPKQFWSLPARDRDAAERVLAAFIEGLLRGPRAPR